MGAGADVRPKPAIEPLARETAIGSNPQGQADELGRDRGPGLLWSWGHLVALWTLAFAQPLFGVLADSPEFFVARGNTRGDVLALAFGVTFGPPTLLLALELPFLWLPRIRQVVHLAIVAALVAAIALQLLKGTGAPAALLIVLALAIGVALAQLYGRGGAVRSMASILVPVPLLALFLFLVVSPVSKLVFPKSEAEAAATHLHGSTPVVLLVFDEFSAESLLNERRRIDPVRFPHFASLARRSTWYRNATTVTDATTKAVPAILSATRPKQDALPIAADYPGSIFTLLSRRYSFADVDEPSTNLCPQSLCTERAGPSTASRLKQLGEDLTIVSLHKLLPRALEDRLPAVDRTFQNFRAQGRDVPRRGGGSSPGIPAQAFENRDVRFEQFLRDIRPGRGKPPLDFLHIQLPHTAWQYLPTGQQYPFNGPEMPGLSDNGVWSTDPRFAFQSQQRYLLQVGYADRLVGELVKRLRDQKMYERALIVVTADHGISFRPGQSRRSAYRGNFPDIAGVPLFIKAPGQTRGRTESREARTIDIVPTIADYLGTRLPWDADGRSLRGPAPPERPVRVAVHPQGTTTVPFAEFVERRNGEATIFDRRFGSDWSDVYAATLQDRDLIGRDRATLASTGAAGETAELDTPSLFGSIEPDGAFLPVFVTGHLTSGGRNGERVAVAVNGRISGIGFAYADEGAIRFGVLVPPSSFHRGSNDVALFRVDGSGRGRRLAPIQRSDRQLTGTTLSKRNGQPAIVTGSGRTIPVTPGAVEGFVDGVKSDGDKLIVHCWAVAHDHHEPAERVLVFADGRLLLTGQPSIQRPDVAKRFGDQSLRSGFELTTVTDEARALTRPSRLRVVALSGGRASELPR